MKHKTIIISLTFFFAVFCLQTANAQVNGFLKDGNRSYDKKDYGDAEKSYNQALDKEPDSYMANFNKGDALFKQGKYKEAAGYFNRASGLEKDKAKDEQGYYNMGNSYLKQKDYPESISAYKKALKINPDDLYAKYNLSYAIAERNKAQKEQQSQNKNNQGNQNKNKGQSDQNQPQNNTQRNNQPYQNTPSKDESGISNAEAEQILNAINNNEEKIRQRLYDNNNKGEPYKTDKPW